MEGCVTNTHKKVLIHVIDWIQDTGTSACHYTPYWSYVV